MAGLLDGISDDAKLGLLTAALAAMSGTGARPGTLLARGGLLGLQAMQDARAGRADERRQQMQEQLWQSQMAENQAQADERRAKLAAEQEASQRQAQIEAGAPRIGPQWNAPTPGASPQVAESFGVQGAQPQSVKFDQYQAMIDRANYYANHGADKQAEAYYKLAEQFRQKFGLSPTVGIGEDGKPAHFVQSESGESKRLPFAPPPKTEYKDIGGSIVPVDMYNTNPQPLVKTMSPGERDTSARGWAQFNYTKTKDAAEASAKAAGGGDAAPKWDSASGQFIYAPTGDSPGRAVRPEGYIEKGKTNAEVTKQLPGIVAEVEGILSSGAPTGSLVGHGFDIAAGAFGRATEGAKATAQLEVLGAKLMFAQPRFEGPQGVLDVKLYEKAAGDIANPNKPIPVKQAAIATIKRMHEKYGTAMPNTSSGGSTPTGDAARLVDDAKAAIAAGAPRDAVMKRLREMGVTDARL